MLISQVKPAMEYGTYKGSGAFGDAIYLKKNVIIPPHVDPFYEFEEIAFYYTDIKSPTELFSNLDDLVNVEIHNYFYNNCSSRAVFDSVRSVITKNGMVGLYLCG